MSLEGAERVRVERIVYAEAMPVEGVSFDLSL